MSRKSKVIAVLPAYNAVKTLKKTYDDIPKSWVDEVILVDDASQDNTVKVAKQLGIKTIIHKKNTGYGGNQKTCYTEALKDRADIIIMIHPDYQYDPKLVPEMIKPLLEEKADVVIGSRMLKKGGAREGGMPWWKFIGNRFLTKIENMVLGLNLAEYHSGYRAYNRKALETVSFQKNSNSFVFDTEMIISLRLHNFRIHEVPISTRYFPEASSVSFWHSTIYGLQSILSLIQYLLQKYRLWGFEKYE